MGHRLPNRPWEVWLWGLRTKWGLRLVPWQKQSRRVEGRPGVQGWGGGSCCGVGGASGLLFALGTASRAPWGGWGSLGSLPSRFFLRHTSVKFKTLFPLLALERRRPLVSEAQPRSVRERGWCRERPQSPGVGSRARTLSSGLDAVVIASLWILEPGIKRNPGHWEVRSLRSEEERWKVIRLVRDLRVASYFSPVPSCFGENYPIHLHDFFRNSSPQSF